MKKIGWMTVALAAVLFWGGCKKETTSNRVPCNNTTPTWNSSVLDIVANSCWGSNCHGTSAPAGDYTTYNGIKTVLLNGKFEQQVLDSRLMPQNDVLPDSILATLQCWVANGFPES